MHRIKHVETLAKFIWMAWLGVLLCVGTVASRKLAPDDDKHHYNFVTGLLSSWGVVIASEVGDKTFFIAAIMAMKHSREHVFAGAMGALATMTILSALLGHAAPTLISPTLTHYAATALFLFFGIRILWEAIRHPAANDHNELDEVERELTGIRSGDSNSLDTPRSKLHSTLVGYMSPVIVEAFTLTFLAEWGDRSQIATIGLAADANVLGVTLGGILGHAMCTGGAVIGGKHLATHIDERMVGILGGVLFLLFAAHSAWRGPPG